MTQTRDAAREPIRKRPADRKARIISTASDQFARGGYDHVSMGDIAAELDITPGALYRHFRNKQELLSRCLLNAMDEFQDAANDTGWHDLESALRTLTATEPNRRGVGALWVREARRVPPDVQTQLREALTSVAKHLGEQIAQSRKAVSADDADLLAWSVLSTLASPSFHRTSVPPRRFAELLLTTCRAVCSTRFRQRRTRTSAAPVDVAYGVPRSSRRAVLLAAASRLFAERGYPAVSMEDIGAAAKIAGPSVYNHFTSKSDLLYEALVRGAHGLDLGIDEALRSAADTEDAARRALRSHVGLLASHLDLVALLRTEGRNLPAEQQHELRVVQHEYLAEWTQLLVDTRDLNEPEARIVLLAVLTIVNDVLATPHLRRREDVAGDLYQMGITVFDAFHG